MHGPPTVLARVLSALLGAPGDASIYNAAELTSLSKLPQLVLVAAAAVLLVQLVVSWRATTGAPARVRGGLFALRAALTVALLVVLLEPGVRLMSTSREANRVAIVVDTSSSMAEPPSGTATSTTRARQAAGAALALVDELQRKAERFAPELYLVDSGLRRATLAEVKALADGATAAGGDASRLSLAVTEVPAGVGQGPLGGLVVISDGADTTGLSTALNGEVRERALALGAPLHTALVGDPEGFVDIALDNAVADEFAFVRNKVTVEVVVRHKGFGGKVVPLTLREDGRVVATTELVLSEQHDDAAPQRATFTFEPQRAGKRSYSITAPVLPDEAIAENNRVDFALKLIRDRIRVLQVAGRPSWDERFVRRLLKENPSVDLISFFILRSTTDVSNASNRELSLIPFPTRELFTEELGTFDVVIFQDFNFRPYQMGMYLENVARFVTDSGGGFMMIGGDLSFSEGEYDETPIADVLPVRLLPGTGHVSTESYSPVVTPAGKNHPITDVADAVSSGQGFGGLPPLEGLNLTAGLMPDAVVLLEHPFERVSSDNGAVAAPVVAVREVGKGRSMAILTDSTWMWALPHVGSGGRGDAHRKLFANALRWLIRDPELSRVKVVVDVPDAGRGIEPNAAVPLEVRSYNAKYQPEGGATVSLVLEPLDANVPSVTVQGTTGDDGIFRTSVTPTAVGAWRVRVDATQKAASGKVENIGSDEDAFVVRSASLEKLHREPRPDILAALAAAGGGKMVPASEIASLPFVDKEVDRVHRQKTEPLWDRAGVLALVVVLAGVEWWWRRRRGFA